MKTNSMKRMRAHILLRMVVATSLLTILAGMPQQPARAGAIRRVKPLGVNTGQCSTWLEACSLQRALSISVAGDEIWAAAGTYLPTTAMTNRSGTFQLKNGVAIYGGFLLGDTNRTDRDPAMHITILSGAIGLPQDNDNSYHVVTGTGTDNTAVLDGFTITGGYANGIGANETLGGGLFNDGGSPTLVAINFNHNTASDGGGMYTNAGSPILNQVSFINNTATDDGGGIYNSTGGAPSLSNVTFVGNHAGNAGGAMYNSQNSLPELINDTFNGNSADATGGQCRTPTAATPPSKTAFYGVTLPL